MDFAWGSSGQLSARLVGATTELSQTEESVLFAQIWTAATQEVDPASGQQVLRVEVQSPITVKNHIIRTYASLSLICGIRQEAMDLIGDCHRKGATRIIEDLEHADCTQHPRNLLPGDDIPACSALFLPIFDLMNPFLNTQAGAVSSPTAVLEILVCETAKQLHNNSDLINIACEMLDKYEFGISPDISGFREWSKFLPKRDSGMASSRSSLSPNRATLSRASSYLNLNSDTDETTAMNFEMYVPPTKAPSMPHPSGVPSRPTSR